MKLYDFECPSCNDRFEQMVESDVRTLPCRSKPCADQARRLLGGKPAFHHGQEQSFTTTTHEGSGFTYKETDIDPGLPMRIPVPKGMKVAPGTPVMVLGRAPCAPGEHQHAIGFGVVGGGRGEDA